MKQLKIGGREIETVFELLGSKEDDMTYSIGWVLSQCNIFCQHLARELGLSGGFSSDTKIYLQRHESQKGFTDIEIVDFGKMHLIIEAKRGFNIPLLEQLEKYADRLLSSESSTAKKMLVVLAESDRQEKWLAKHVPKQVKEVEVQAISWQAFRNMAKESMAETSAHFEKGLLRQLINYLGKVTVMQNQNSNLVYVVALNNDVFFDETGDTFIDVVEKHKKYFHPVGDGWPKEPQNYIAFRYHGKLQSIHHIDSYKIVEDFKDAFNLKSPSPADEKHYLYELGPAIHPPKEVPTNDSDKRYTQILRARHCECFIDLLLTCDSISEALAKTKERQNR